MAGSGPAVDAQGAPVFAHIPDRALNFFGRYLADVGEQSIGAVSSIFDGSQEINARVEMASRASYTIRLNGGLINVLSAVYAAVVENPTTGVHETYSGLSSLLAAARYLKSDPPLSQAGSVTTTLQMSLFMSLCFVAFHEYAHARAGHFGILQKPSTRRLQLSISEAGGAPLIFSAAAQQGAIKVPISKHIELEADILALANLLGVAEELLLEEIDGGGDPEGDIQMQHDKLALGEHVLYASCLCLCIFEVRRKLSGAEGGYPRPFTRILAALRQFVLSTKPDWNRGEEADRVTIWSRWTESETEEYARIFVNVVDLCNFCCDITGLELPKRYRLTSTGDFLSDALAVSGIVGVDAAPRTAEAKELRRLDASAARFKAMMRPFRILPWDLV